MSVLSVLFACAKPVHVVLPATTYTCRASVGSFRAGFAKVDITPPAGLGLQGHGPEGRQAVGARTRLYARAMVLQATNGERVAFVVADLPQVSAILHRETVLPSRLDPSACIGADRLMLSATHTHAGPGHFFLGQLINDAGSSVTGYDPRVVEFLSDRFANAIKGAIANLRPARAAWGEVPIWGHSRNRSLEPYLRNRPVASLPFPPPNPPGRVLQPRHFAVDPTFSLLRVDMVGDDGQLHPAGAFSVFGMHNTGLPAVNDRYDADIFGVVALAVERHIDGLNGNQSADGTTRAVSLLANGTEGDVSPDWPEDRVCPVPQLRRVWRPGAGPRSAVAPTAWDTGSRRAQELCLDEGIRYVQSAGAAIGARAIDLYDSLGNRLSATFELRRSFRTIRLRHAGRVLGICDEARTGTSVLGGAEDGRTRYFRWSVFHMIPTGLEEGGAAINPDPAQCHGHKRIVAGPFLQKLIAGEWGFPQWAQFMVVRMGSRVVGAVPWEVTVTAGFRIKDAMVAGAGNDGPEAGILIGLANGYMQYLTTAEEYVLQHYEGGSNIWGPGTAGMVQRQLSAMSGEVYSGAGAAVVEVIEGRPGKARRIYRP